MSLLGPSTWPWNLGGLLICQVEPSQQICSPCELCKWRKHTRVLNMRLQTSLWREYGVLCRYPWHVVFSGFRILFESENIYGEDYLNYQWVCVQCITWSCMSCCFVKPSLLFSHHAGGSLLSCSWSSCSLWLWSCWTCWLPRWVTPTQKYKKMQMALSPLPGPESLPDCKRLKECFARGRWGTIVLARYAWLCMCKEVPLYALCNVRWFGPFFVTCRHTGRSISGRKFGAVSQACCFNWPSVCNVCSLFCFQISHLKNRNKMRRRNMLRGKLRESLHGILIVLDAVWWNMRLFYKAVILQKTWWYVA